MYPQRQGGALAGPSSAVLVQARRHKRPRHRAAHRSTRAVTRSHAKNPALPEPGAAAPARCPFALAADFIIKEDDKRPPKLTPLGKAIFAPTPKTGSAGLWLMHGSPGQDKPGRLVTGLRRLTHNEEFLNQIPATQGFELGLKARAFSDPGRAPNTAGAAFVAEPCSLAGQAECLELFLDYLPKRYPAMYALAGAGAGRTISVASTGETHAVADYAERPLELCARIAQEDLVLMRVADNPEMDNPVGDQHVMTAAAVVFSFAALMEKLGQPLRFIHAPVPGYEADMAKLLNRTFNAIDPAEPLWRNNWGIFDDGSLEPSYGTAELLARLDEWKPPAERWLKTEYETLRRLPRSNNILFSIKTFASPLSELGTVPGAAACLAESLRGMSQGMRGYKGVKNPLQQEEMLRYLDVLAAQADGVSTLAR